MLSRQVIARHRCRSNRGRAGFIPGVKRLRLARTLSLSARGARAWTSVSASLRHWLGLFVQRARMQRFLVAVGAVLLLAGLFWPWLSRLGLGRLPGDIRVETANGVFYFPITTCVIISAVVSLILWFLRR